MIDIIIVAIIINLGKRGKCRQQSASVSGDGVGESSDNNGNIGITGGSSSSNAIGAPIDPGRQQRNERETARDVGAEHGECGA